MRWPAGWLASLRPAVAWARHGKTGVRFAAAGRSGTDLCSCGRRKMQEGVMRPAGGEKTVVPSGWVGNPARLALALFEPDIPPNTGTLLRLGACLGVPLHIIEPAGFVFSDRRLRRAGLDYLPHAGRVHHEDWRAFRAWAHEEGRRIVLLTTRAGTSYTDLIYLKGDVLLLGRESAGVPEEV
ncbi:MAG: hypothetical protein D6740_11415, partial [Alphaproteobacteria bacterium]